MPIPSTGEIKLNDDVNATLQADTNESNVSLGDNNTVKFTAVGDGTTISGRSMSELRGQTLFQINPSTEATGALGESLHMDGLSSSHNSVKVLEPASTTAPAFTSRKGTFSFWIKIHETTNSKRYLYTSGTGSSNVVSILLHSSGTNHKLYFRVNGAYYTSEAIFVDKAGWYNFVISLDSISFQNAGGSTEHVRAYVNGIRLAWQTPGNLSANISFEFGTNQRINDWAFGDGYGADATYANFIFVDGSALLPNEFGELSHGIWVPKQVNKPSTNTLITTNLTGNYEFIGGSLQDTSGNGNHLTANGTSTGGTALQNNYGSWKTPGSNSSYLKMPDIINSHSTTINMWIHPVSLSTTEKFFHATKEIYGIWEIVSGGYSVYFAGVYLIQNRPAQSRWTMLTLTTTGPRDAQFYIDGNLVNTYTAGSDFAQDYNYHDNTLGYTHHTSTPNNGEMIFGEVQIYSTGLTATQVLQNFNATKYKYFYGLNGWHLNLNNSDEGSIVSGSLINLDAGDWDADGTDETSFSGTTWSDKSGNNHHATLTNGPAYSSNNGGYFLFDGSDDFATITSNSSFQSLADFSLEMWIYPVTVSDDEMINLLYTSGSNYKWDLRFSTGSSQNFRWTVADSGGNYSSAQDIITNTTTGTVPLNQWSHVTATFSSTNGIMNVYINGALTDTKSPSSGTFSTRTNGSENLLLAKRTDGYHANIGIAQSRVYSKALTAQEVVQNFRATQGHYNVLSLADISGNAKGGVANGTNLDGSDHTGDKPDVSYATLNPSAESTGGSYSNGNLKVTSQQDSITATMAVNSGKWYAEATMGSITNAYVAIFGADSINPNMGGSWASAGAIAYKQNGDQYSLPKGGSSSTSSYGASYTSGDVIGIALDLDSTPNTITFYKNGASQGTTTNGPTYISSNQYTFGFYAGTGSATGTVTFNFGAKGFSYTVPSGYKALSSNNLPTATGVDPVNQKKPRDYFESVTYTGNATARSIKVGFQPDFTWIKDRTTNYSHVLLDSVRGVNSEINSNDTSAVYTETNGLTAFTSTGFNLGNLEYSYNKSGDNYVSWNWKAGGAPTVDNSASAGAAPTLGSVMIDGVASTASLAGSIAATKISANTKSGFSIVSFTGNDTVGASVAHGLGVKPQLILFKARTRVNNWGVYAEPITAEKFLVLNEADTESDATGPFNDTEPTSSIITLGNSLSYNNAGTMIAYCFHSVDGYSKIGSYTGNGSSDGPFIYTGFKPAWVIIKSSSTGNDGDWMILDNARDPENTRNARIDANTSDAEATDAIMDFHSNGFKLITSSAAKNRDGYEFIYLAIAEDPAKYAQGTGQESDIEKFLEKGTGETSYPENNFGMIDYTGTGGERSTEGLKFKPDFTLTKRWNGSGQWSAFDSVRGVTKRLNAGTNAVESTVAASLQSFIEGGFTFGNSTGNSSGESYIAYNWKAGDTQVTKKPTYTSAGILTSNLVLHYNFADSNTYAGTGADLTNIATSSTVSNALQNSPTFVDRSYGNYFDLDGTNDYIRTDWQQNSSTTMTFETWQWVDNDSSYRYIWGDFSTTGANASGRFGTRIYNDNQVTVFIGNGTNDSAFTSGVLDYTPYLEKWTHFVWTINGTTGKLYINGILMSVKTFTNSIAANGTNNMALGNYTGGAITTQTFDGKFGQARIYTAELTQAQIRANYDATRTLYQGVGTTANVLQTGLLNNIDVDSYSSYDPNSFGIANKAAVFNGSSSYISANNPNSGGGARSFSAWIKTTSTSFQSIITNGGATHASGLNLFVYNNKLYSTSGKGNGENYGPTSSTSINTGNWVHCVVTMNGTAIGSTIKLYVDGTLDGTHTTTVLITDTYDAFRIGGRYINGSYAAAWFNGQIDQTRIFSSALTADQVKILYNETSSTTSTLNPTGISNCTALYNFDSDSGTAVDDISTNYDGTASNVTFAFDNTTGYRIKDQTSNNLSLGSLVNTTINEANSWGTSLKYDGTGDFVTLPVGLGRTATQDVTRELWVKIDDYPASGNTDGLLYIGDMSANQYYENLRVTNTGTIDYQERPTNSSGGSDFILSTDSSNILVEGAWHHVAYTSQGRIKKIYINGKLVTTKTASNDRPNNSTYGGSLGSFRGSTTATTQGEIAQFRSYTSALTDAQIKANFDATKAQFYSPLVHSLVSANEKAGFSIATYTGEGSETDMVAHGLTKPPEFQLIKNLSTAAHWACFISQNVTKPESNSESFLLGSKTGAVTFSSGTGVNFAYTMDGRTNTAGDNYVSYNFHSVPGYLKIVKYTGTGSARKVYIGFEPRLILIKNFDGDSWYFLDKARGDAKYYYIGYQNGTGQSYTLTNQITFVNELNHVHFAGGSINQSGNNFIMLAFA